MKKTILVVLTILLMATIAKADTCQYVINPNGGPMIYVCVDEHGNVYFPFGK